MTATAHGPRDPGALPVDPESKARLARDGLRLGLVDTSSASFALWLQAGARGFHNARPTREEVGRVTPESAYRRTTAVWDDAADPGTPVATVSSWVSPLSVPGPLGPTLDVDAWAISSVTVSPTHRRHGIARALLEAELRTAHAAGVPAAMLTVSEATIYGRYGFAPAARCSDFVVDTRRAGWRGPDPVAERRGAVRFVEPEVLRQVARPVFEAARRRAPGQVPADDALWSEITHATLSAEDAELAPNLRAIRYEAEGETRGFALYRVEKLPEDHDVTTHTATVLHLAAATDDAYAALWRFLVGLDLVAWVRASLRSVDEPLRWLIRDQRAMGITRDYDHLWVRLLDVPAALEARGYAAPGAAVVEVADPLGFAAGRFLLEVDAAGGGRVTPGAAEVPAGVPVLRLGVAELGALYLGGVGAGTLARAGRVTEGAPGDAARVDALFHSPAAPWLGIWF